MPHFNTEQPAFKDFRSIVRERTNPIVAWVGAGLSRPAGLPSWKELRESLIQDLCLLSNSVTDRNRRSGLKTRIKGIKAEPDYWRCFSQLEDALGKAEFCAGIRNALIQTYAKPVPTSYERIWKIGVSGILTLNIDGFAKRAYASVHGEKALSEFDGKHIHERVLKNNIHFVGNLHGNLDDDRSWVFTHGELKSLLSNPRYRTFIAAILCTRTVLFIGISAEDDAVCNHLESLRDIDFNAGDHFWLTERNDEITDSFAKDLGIRTILFEASQSDFSAIDDFFNNIEGFVPQEEIAPPAYRNEIKTDMDTSLPTPQELCGLDSDNIRWLLNVNAAAILSPEDQRAYKIYDNFCSEYDQAIYRAWYVDTKEGANCILGYKLLEEVKHPGAFGRVFRADSPTGETVAIKVLHESIRQDPERLQSFRRGARAMKILAENNLDGMVRYREACEIPAMVAMDWVEGPNLKIAVESRYIAEWKDFLKIGFDLAKILRTAHRLPERVLHRDVRPPNIMLEDRYSDDTDWKLIVLDFDLSWHKGAIEKSILSSASPTGYLAPEQLSRIKDVSTRNAAVDSFGVGMTLFFMVSQRDPLPNEHMRSEWSETVRHSCENFGATKWKCLPRRIHRLILKATRNAQHKRCDMAFIERELERLYNIETGNLDYFTMVFLTEEIAARTELEYIWNSDCDSATLKTTRGLEVVLTSDEPSAMISGKLSWAQEHIQRYQNVRKFLPKRATQAIKILNQGTWIVKMRDIGSYNVLIKFNFTLPLARDQIEILASSLAKAVFEIAKIA